MQWLLNAVGGLYTFLNERLWAFMITFVEWVKALITEVLPNVVLIMLPDGAAEFLRTIDLTQIQEYAQPVTWWIPFWSILTIYLVAYSFAASIRLVRFVIGWIPTVEG